MGREGSEGGGDSDSKNANNIKIKINTLITAKVRKSLDITSYAEAHLWTNAQVMRPRSCLKRHKWLRPKTLFLCVQMSLCERRVNSKIMTKNMIKARTGSQAPSFRAWGSNPILNLDIDVNPDLILNFNLDFLSLSS